MFVTLAIFLVVLSITCHELGHALYMQKYGIRIKTFSVGLPFPLKIRFSSKRLFGGANIQLTPFLLGAYVEPEEPAEIEKLPYKAHADINGAGTLANCLFAIIMLLTGRVFTPDQSLIDSRGTTLLVLFGLLYIGRKLFSRYLFVVIGWCMVALVVSSLFHSPTEALAGPVGIVKIITGYASSLSGAFKVAGILSLAIGLTNALPFFPLDGGRTMSLVLRPCGKNL